MEPGYVTASDKEMMLFMVMFDSGALVSSILNQTTADERISELEKYVICLDGEVYLAYQIATFNVTE
jgi:hypothetical protein